MKRFIVIVAVIVTMISFSVNAQTATTVHAVWTPNPASDNVVQYTVTLDAATPVVLLATACTTTCSQVLTVPTLGSHTVVLIAQNQGLSGLQSSPPSTVTFVLKAAPTTPVGLNITN